MKAKKIPTIKTMNKRAMKRSKGGAWLASPAGQRTADPNANGGCSANARNG